MIVDLIQYLKDEWNEPKNAVHNGELSSFRLQCSFSKPIENIGINWNGYVLPNDLHVFWENCSKAKLFEDMQYGQWGLELLSFGEAIALSQLEFKKRPNDYVKGDLLIGKFIGDSDLLIIRCDNDADDYGKILIALPIDNRSGWDVIEPSFTKFFENYVRRDGEKYWEK